EPVHPGHGIVALGEVTTAHEQPHLFLDRQLHRHRLFQLHPPDGFRGLLDEGTVPLFTLSHGVLGAAGVGHVDQDDPDAVDATVLALHRVVADAPESLLAGVASGFAL